MISKTKRFHHNRLYQLLARSSSYTHELLPQIHQILHEEPEVAEFTNLQDGSYFHLVVLFDHDPENVAFRIVYALSNAGADPNVTNNKGNTPLHELLQEKPEEEVNLDLVQALIRVGVDLRIVNKQGKRADAYVKSNPQLIDLLRGYRRGIWSAVQSSDIAETERLIQGFIKVDCKHNTNKTLLDKANDLNCSTIIHLLAEHQVTIEFLHSVLACDWQRAELIYQHEKSFLKINACDSIHRLTWFRTKNRSCSKPLLEFCLETKSSEPWRILFDVKTFQWNVNVLCTDGLPLFFHCFDRSIPDAVREAMIKHANMYTKSITGETFLFHLIRLYCEEENEKYLQLFQTILIAYPLLLTERNEHHRSLVEELQLTSAKVYLRVRPFYEIITHVIIRKLNDYPIIEQMIYHRFGHYVLMIVRNQHLPMIKDVYQILSLVKVRQGLIQLIDELFQSVVEGNLEKLQMILKKKKTLYQAKDRRGRTSAHLAVLHHRFDILKFLVEHYRTLINARDHLYRTPFHYACILNDQRSIDILHGFQTKDFIDCFNIRSTEYLERRDLCSEEFHARDSSIDRSISDAYFLQVFLYPTIKKHVENDEVEQIKTIDEELMQMGFQLTDLPLDSSLDQYSHGERYVPLLFFALHHRSVGSIRYFLQRNLTLGGRIYLTEDQGRNEFSWIPEVLYNREKPWVDLRELIDSFQLTDLFQVNSVTVNLPSNEDETHRFGRTVQNLLTVHRLNRARKSNTCLLM